ncbi:MAG: TetR/AcrR family transcriptional regulator, partial [Thermincola sp.]|nr:TetR/AcrR family transcriptional regulator [Thermincola sp.]
MGHPGDSDKRKKILKAAVKVFSQKGFHAAKVDEIAQLADVGKGTVYEYFSSKEEVFQEMFKAGMQFYVENISN